MNRLEALLTKLDKDIKDRVEGLSKHLETQVTNVFDALEKSVGSVNTALAQTNKHVDELRAKLDGLAEKCALVVTFGERLEAVEKRSESSVAN